MSSRTALVALPILVLPAAFALEPNVICIEVCIFFETSLFQLASSSCLEEMVSWKVVASVLIRSRTRRLELSRKMVGGAN